AGSGWSSPHAGEGISRYPEEAVMITGDGNLVEVQATVRYTVRDPRAYLLNVSEPNRLMRSAAESSLREIIAALRFDDLLTSGRARVQREALERLTRRCHVGGAGGLGIRLEGLSVHDLHPPKEVVDAYHRVTQAMEHRDQVVNEAKAGALRKEREAEA